VRCGSSDRYVLAEVPGSLPSTHPFTFWRMKGQESVLLTWANGVQGVRVVLPVAGDTLLGRAIVLDHMVAEDSGTVGTAVGVRRLCDEEIPQQYRRVGPQLTVDLSDGSSLRIGMPVAWQDDEERSDRKVVPADATGVFTGARKIVVSHNLGRITGIRLVHPDSTRYEPLLADLTLLLGAHERSGAVGWRDRELSVRFGRLAAEPGGFYLTYTQR
jgi:hypothetical protein